jgi:hypothetical protein
MHLTARDFPAGKLTVYWRRICKSLFPSLMILPKIIVWKKLTGEREIACREADLFEIALFKND